MIKYEGSYPLLALEEIDDVTLALGGDSCFISLWNWKQNEVKCKVFGHPGSVQCISFYHPYLVSSGGDSKLKIWDIREAHTSLGLIATNRKM
jgi:WD40 repeat protein